MVYNTSWKILTVKVWWQFSTIASIPSYSFGAPRRLCMKRLDYLLQAARSIRGSAKDGNHSSLTAFLQPCMVEKKHLSCIFFDSMKWNSWKRQLGFKRLEQSLFRWVPFLHFSFWSMTSAEQQKTAVGSWIISSGLGRGKALEILGPEGACRCVQLPQRGLRKARALPSFSQ